VIRIGKLTTILFPVILTVLTGILRADEVKLNVSANRDQVYLGESITLTVKVSGDSSPSDPDLSGMTNCSIRFLGSHSDNRHSIMFVNGKMTQESFVGREFAYEITPSIAGKFMAGPVKLNAAGRTITQSGPTITVSGIEAQNDVLVHITSSRESVLVDEPFEIRLSIALKRLKGQYADANPLDPRDPPQLNVPFLNAEPIQGLDMPDIRGVLQQSVVSGGAPGFAINEYVINRNPFDMAFNFDGFMQSQKAQFMFERRVVETNGESYFEYAVNLKYAPREEGNYTFGPALFKGKIVIAADAQGRGITKPVFAVGPACTVRVVPPPEAGRPPSYIGAIGSNLVAEASLDAQTCNLGDPLKLTLSISGNVSMDNIYPPLLNQQTNLTRAFKIYDDSIQAARKEKAREYTYTVRPIREGTIELPSIDVSYYDSVARAYKTVKTKPIPVRANKGATVGSEIIIATATNKAAEEKTRVSEMFIPAPLNMDAAGAEPDGISGDWRLLVAVVAGPVVYLITLLVIYMRRNAVRNAEAARKRKALSTALSLLAGAEKQAKTDVATAQRQICDAVRTYLSDRFGAEGAGLTPGDVRDILASRLLDTSLIDDLCEILERNFNAEFDHDALTGADPMNDCADLRTLLTAIDGNCRATERKKNE